MPHRILAEMLDRTFNHVIAVPMAGVGVIVSSINTNVQIVQEITSAPLSGYASIASAVYLTLMIAKTVYEFYSKWKDKK